MTVVMTAVMTVVMTIDVIVGVTVVQTPLLVMAPLPKKARPLFTPA